MTEKLRLMAVLAHPDDEALALGAALAKYAAEGVETYLITATRGERGWAGTPGNNPGPKALGQMREQELYAAAAILGMREVHLLGYHDGDLDQADPSEAVRRLVEHLRRVRPQVVVTFGPSGVYGHPDHIAICQFTTAAVAAAANAGIAAQGAPHQVAKLYYFAETAAQLADYQRLFGDLVMEVDGIQRRGSGWESWAVTTEVDTAAYWQQAWRAIEQHRSQLPSYDILQQLPLEQRRTPWLSCAFYRVYSLVNGGRRVERDLFAGLRAEIEAEPIEIRQAKLPQ